MKQWIVLILVLLAACDNSQQKPLQGYVEGENTYLASPYSGNVVKKHIVRGQKVTKGDVLYQLELEPQNLIVKENEGSLRRAQHILDDLKKPKRRAEIDAIKAQVKQADAQLKLAGLRVKRFQKLQKQQAAERDTVDAAIARYEELEQLKLQYQENLELAALGSRESQISSQEALVNALTEKLKQSQWALAQKTIKAPESGIVFDTFFNEGEFVSAAQSVVALLTPNNMRIEFFVPVKSLAHLALAQKVDFTCAGCAANNMAVIEYISPEAEFVPPLVYSEKNYHKLVYRIYAHIQKPMLFKPGQPVTVDISAHE